MARIISIDFGLKRIGIAVTDPGQIIATALATKNQQDVMEYLESYISREPVEAFVVGQPKNLDNTDVHITPHIEGFVKRLKKKFPEQQVYRWDERFTSKMAQQSIFESGVSKSKRQDKGMIDAVSAVIILQDFLASKQIKRDIEK